MISEGNLLRTSEDGFLVFKTKGLKEMVFSPGIVVCSVEAENYMRLEMKPILHEGQNQETCREIQSVQLDCVKSEDCLISGHPSKCASISLFLKPVKNGFYYLWPKTF